MDELRKLSFQRLAILVICSTSAGAAEAGFLALIAGISWQLASGGSHRIWIFEGLRYPTVLALVLLSILVASKALALRVTSVFVSERLSSVRKLLLRDSLGNKRIEDLSFSTANLQYKLSLASTDFTRQLRDIVEGLSSGIVLLVFALTGFIINVLTGFLFLIFVSLILLALFRSRRKLKEVSGEKVGEEDSLSAVVESTVRTYPELLLLRRSERVVAWSDQEIEKSSAIWKRHDFLLKLVPLLFTSLTYLVISLLLIIMSNVDISNFESFAPAFLLILRSQNYGNKCQVAFAALGELDETRKAFAINESLYSVEAHRPPLGDTAQPEITKSDPGKSVPLLQFRGVQFEYPGTEGNDTGTQIEFPDISLNLGELVGVSGPSGRGKTTLAQLAVGNLVPSSGTVESYGKHGTQTSGPGISFLPQSPSFVSGSVIMNIDLFASPYDPQRLQELLSEIGLLSDYSFEEFSSKRIGMINRSLSGGQLQRVALVRILLNPWPLIILDEPTSALDPDSTSSILSLLEGLRNSHGILVISHDQSVLSRCDRIVTL